MGGIQVDARMRSTVDGLFAAGEAVGGASGANRLSGNAISEAFVFGEIAGREAAARAALGKAGWPGREAADTRDRATPRRGANVGGASAVALLRELKELMWADVGPFRARKGLERALSRIRAMRSEDLDRVPIPADPTFCIELTDWHELRSALLVAEAVAVAALGREESRGAHQRDDFIAPDPTMVRSQLLGLADGVIAPRWDGSATTGAGP
jgi:succinate dehydrogenase / fumarate reductase flavoprotein subunit/fumarate reductase (CoM/CoB) subunit A